ncbi:LPP20 family lipoprotein [Bdellovibrionota bacterium FG-2]
MSGKSTKTTLVFLFLILAASSFAAHESCADSKDRPLWIAGALPEKWNRNTYLTGVGSGKTLEDASASAKRALVEVIHSRVETKFSSETNSTLSQHTSGKTEGLDENQSQGKVEIKAEADLRGVEIVERYEDAAEKVFYALAALDKLKARNLIAQDATHLKAILQSKLELFTKEGRVADAYEVLALFEKFRAVKREYSVFGSPELLVDPLSAAELEQLKGRIREKTASQTLFVDYQGEGAGVREQLGSCLSEKGFRIVEARDANGGSPKYIAKTALFEVAQKIAVEGWVNYEFTLKAGFSGGSIAPIVVSGSRASPGRTKQACFDKVKEDLIAEVCGKLLKSINGI